MKTFFTADNHFNHKNIIKYQNRPFKNVSHMNEVMIKNWNEKVSKSDRIFILGYLSMDTNGENTQDILNQLNGAKFLIKGNHDSWANKTALQKNFSWIRNYHTLRENNQVVILLHYPILQWDRRHKGSIHLYGHVHTEEVKELVGTKSYNVGVDVNNFYPVELYDIVKKFES